MVSCMLRGAVLVETKLCIKCFHKHFGPDAKPAIVTWGPECRDCRTPTGKGTLVKCDVTASMAGQNG